MKRDKKGQFTSDAKKRLKSKIAFAQARIVWQWSVFVVLIGIFPVMEIKDRLNKEYVFENPSAAATQVRNQAQDEAHAESGEAQMEDGTSRGKNSVSVAEVVGGTQVSSVNGSAIEAKIRKAFSHSPEIALAIARAESSLDPHKPSNTDITKDGHVYSWGLFQLNLTVTNIDGVACNEAFIGRNNDATVKDMKLYKQCVKLATDPEKNIKVAVAKYEGRGNYTAWGAFTNGSYKRHLN